MKKTLTPILRRSSLVLVDVATLALSILLSWRLFPCDVHPILIIGTILISAKVILSVRFGLYHAILRFAGMPLASAILRVTSLAFAIGIIVAQIPTTSISNPGFFVMDFLFSSFLIGMIRFAPRYWAEARQPRGTKRVLIFGAGDLGEDVARKLLRNPEEYQLIGFVDDNKEKIGKRLHNFPIWGPSENLQEIVAKTNVGELIIAISAMEGDRVRDLTRLCRKNGVACRIVPSFPDMLKQDLDIKNIDIADLLRREPKDLDMPQIKRFIQGKAVLITGAGGSIGSEISRQCLKFGARKLILIDHSEFNLYTLQEELGSSDKICYVLLNVLYAEPLQICFKEEKPDIVFHAAAYKHVPLVEENPFEGVINNVKGTEILANLAATNGVRKFVLISTDKAVRPTSVMGASKRAAELFIQNLNVRTQTEFISVRFGNVLGSSGSVIPKFLEQIKKGGPVTVTHPEVTRYFMLIPEAVQLVMQAASIGNGGEIFILNMGKPIRIADMAEDLIYLSGREPHKDVVIEYMGLRPGEKLYEELLHDEAEKKTHYENITIGRATYMDWDKLNEQIDAILDKSRKKDRDGLLEGLKVLVPEFMHADLAISQRPGPKVVSLRPQGRQGRTEC